MNKKRNKAEARSCLDARLYFRWTSLISRNYLKQESMYNKLQTHDHCRKHNFCDAVLLLACSCFHRAE